jgi:beta-galactosidase
MVTKVLTTLMCVIVTTSIISCSQEKEETVARERLSINEGWRFFKYESADDADGLIYDERPAIDDARDDRDADTRPTEAVGVERTREVLKPWILPSGNNFIKDPGNHYTRPEGNPGEDFPFVQAGFDDSSWELVDLPHDWAVKGPFLEGDDSAVGGGMGRLPSPGVAWYRRMIDIPASDTARSVFLDVDGAMSYAMVWINGKLAGGWPYGYNSWRLDLTPFIKPGEANQLAIRLDNPSNSSRWYPGGGLYRNVWLTKTSPLHVAHWGTFITTRDVSDTSATIEFEATIDNRLEEHAEISAETFIFSLDPGGEKTGSAVASFRPVKTTVNAGGSIVIGGTVKLDNPRLWGPPPSQTPNLYVAVTTLWYQEMLVDHYETRFGIRTLEFNPETGVHVNGEQIRLHGVNQHHDLGALGAAFNKRAAERQLEILRELGCNAIRMAHNPPAPELLELTDRMGFLVVNEVFDVWERRKTPLDFHLIFPEWHEQDVRALVRRDRNCPSVIMWSFGNEVGEQYTGTGGAALARRLHEIIKDEDPTRPTTTSMNYAKPDMPMPATMDIISLNYQGEGIRNAPAYSHLRGITTPPLYSGFRAQFPDKVIISSENAATLSTRGIYLFPVTGEVSAPVMDGNGGDPVNQHVSSYELYTAPFGSSPDKVFASMEQNPYVAGGFVWSGWDYLGEPTPYYMSRSTHYGIIDLAGFKKDRFYLYQSRWRPGLPMAHILPHWNWPERFGEITPVHVFTTGDEAELFLNGISLGRKVKGEYEYRLRWDDVIYQPGELKVIAYKDGELWAEEIVRTTDEPFRLEATADRSEIKADGRDLSFITVRVTDVFSQTVPVANNLIRFSIEGPGRIVATDNGDPTDFVPFPSNEREAFNGLALVIVQSEAGELGEIIVTAESSRLEGVQVVINSQ